jgi:hypothetical protein
LLTLLAMTARIDSSLLGRNVANPCRMRGDILKAIFEMHPLARSRVLFERYTRPPFLRGPDRPRRKSAAAVRTHIAEPDVDAIGTKGALIAADPRLNRIRRKILVAIFAVRSKLQRHDGRVLRKGKGSSQIGRVIRMTNIPRFRTDISPVTAGTSLVKPAHDEKQNYFCVRHSLMRLAISTVAGSRMVEGVREKRGAGAGWVAPWRLTNVFRAAMCG